MSSSAGVNGGKAAGPGLLAAIYRKLQTSRLNHPLRIVNGHSSSAAGNPYKIMRLIPKLFGQPLAELNKTMKIGVVQGSDGRSVISGIFDYLQDWARGSTMSGVKGWPAGVMKLSTDFVYPCRNEAFHHTYRPISALSLYPLQSNRTSSSFQLLNPSTSFQSKFGQSIRMTHSLTRSWSVKLWAAEKEEKLQRGKRKHRIDKPALGENTIFDTLSSFQLPSLKSVLKRPEPLEHQRQINRTINRPPLTQFDEGFPSPSSSEEVQLAPLLARPNLLITRDIEWANIMFAIEQESRYIIVDPNYPHSPVGYIREQSNVLYRQLLRTRRPFIASITDSIGNEIFRIRRPFWLVNSTIYAEVGDKVVGVVHRRWHVWRRIYDLYLGNKQFAMVENPGFWNWTFTLKDDEENVLAQIDRDWRGLGLELFTDAGQYVIRFGNPGSSPPFGQTSVIPELEVARPLSLTERAVTVALAVSLDTDYFSRGGGWGLPILIAGE
ncbi:Diphosphate--fructose-6-phosphate 1-phosphotransferase protein [Dioscorea alata]|uniref:Diphosphate--fructose-6-phosphate 1-phosphotransferase protein n=1 Tax=Dioscorea alata TaxID=55571 RepID=A0ACB7WLB6_DIOAL|nr:Diphosphate--fructose-6-phosphate 1-phosphotransferase protein [Dioscorea alata]